MGWDLWLVGYFESIPGAVGHLSSKSSTISLSPSYFLASSSYSFNHCIPVGIQLWVVLDCSHMAPQHSRCMITLRVRYPVSSNTHTQQERLRPHAYNPYKLDSLGGGDGEFLYKAMSVLSVLPVFSKLVLLCMVCMMRGVGETGWWPFMWPFMWLWLNCAIRSSTQPAERRASASWSQHSSIVSHSNSRPYTHKKKGEDVNSWFFFMSMTVGLSIYK